MRTINLSKKIVDKILFLRTSHAFTIFMLSFALFSAIANAVFLSYYIEEENYYIYLVSSFFLINGFLLTIIFIGEKKYVKEVYYDDNFISKLNNSLRKELEDDLLKLQEYYDGINVLKYYGINVLEYKTFALLKCSSYYEKGRIDEELIDKIKKYYINLFKKKIAKELEEKQKEKERSNILKTNQELILKKIGE
ncbi:hypothetical protein [Campylobacter coli]|uniref:hypothetical protein n=1 Tax=Campylobacter coli TaxID=195 RepID=UPI0011A3D21E|nr:hypothetical protein [Campylobacter coli]